MILAHLQQLRAPPAPSRSPRPTPRVRRIRRRNRGAERPRLQRLIPAIAARAPEVIRPDAEPASDRGLIRITGPPLPRRDAGFRQLLEFRVGAGSPNEPDVDSPSAPSHCRPGRRPGRCWPSFSRIAALREPGGPLRPPLHHDLGRDPRRSFEEVLAPGAGAPA